MNQDIRPSPRPGIMEIAAYVPGGSGEEGRKVFKLSSNETPLGPSPAAIEAARGELDRMEYYPDGASLALKQAIAEVHGLNPANLLCANGSDEILGLLAQAYLQPGDEAIFTEHGFLVYRIQTLAAGGRPVVVKERDHTADVDAILAAVSDRTRIVFIANPNNPTGTYLPFGEVRRLQAGLPENVLLIIDAAYAEYVRRNDYEAGIELVSQANNVVMTRTFSKIHGLAALRIGWIYAPGHVIDVLDRVRGPFNVNSMAIAAGSAAIRDRAHVDKAVAHNEQWLPWLTSELTAIGLKVTPSVGNFILIHFPEGDPTRSAEAADRFLNQEGYVLRRVTGYGFPNALRMSIGAEEANRGVVTALSGFLKG